MYVKSERINSYSLSGAASNTLLITCLSSELVRSPACATRKFFPLMSILDGTGVPSVLWGETSLALRRELATRCPAEVPDTPITAAKKKTERAQSGGYLGGPDSSGSDSALTTCETTLHTSLAITLPDIDLEH
jgi:hypothetical protein